MHRLLLLLLLAPLTAHADTARLQSLGDMDLLTEDTTNVFTNPALMARYSNRAWFSLGVNVPSFDANGLAATTGSACHEGHVTLSPVLAAMAVPVEIGAGALRFSLGRSTTAEEIDRVLSMFADIAPSI